MALQVLSRHVLLNYYQQQQQQLYPSLAVVVTVVAAAETAAAAAAAAATAAATLWACFNATGSSTKHSRRVGLSVVAAQCCGADLVRFRVGRVAGALFAAFCMHYLLCTPRNFIVHRSFSSFSLLLSYSRIVLP
jgi:phosphotransferase system  glucose/maltose/N-acetylglucosamine-specific IIC component